MAKCHVCGKKINFLFDTCAECRTQEASETAAVKKAEKNAESLEKAKLEHEASQVKLTTAPSLAGYQIEETVDIVSAEYVYGMNLLAKLKIEDADFFGGRSGVSQKALRDARVACLNELRREAASLGANAVIAVDLNYGEISGKEKSMLLLVASGTAVKVAMSP